MTVTFYVHIILGGEFNGSLSSYYISVCRGNFYFTVLTFVFISSQVKESCAFMGHCSMRQRFVLILPLCVLLVDY